MATDAMSAMLTRTFAFKSNAVISPLAASRRMGVPLIMMLIMAGSKGKIPFHNPVQLIKSNIPEIMVKMILRCSSSLNIFKLMRSFMLSSTSMLLKKS